MEALLDFSDAAHGQFLVYLLQNVTHNSNVIAFLINTSDFTHLK